MRPVSRQMELAPHQLFVRNVSIYLAAFNPAKGRRQDEEISLSEYNVLGLTDIALGEGRFEPLSSYDGQPKRQEDRILIFVHTANDFDLDSDIAGCNPST